jgi:hypothetical protein
MKLTIKGKRWNVTDLRGVGRDALGTCNHQKRILHIPIHGDSRHDLDVIIHELLHALFPYLTEDEVNKSATIAARLLWRLNWRRD